MRKTIVLFATLFVAFTACFAFSGVSKGDDIPIPLGSTQSSQIGSTNYLYYNLGMGENLNGWYYAGDEFSNLDGSFENEKMIYNITPPVN